MNAAEPILTPEDLRRWAAWERAALAHAKTALHRRRVDRARAIVEDFAARVRIPYVGWSAGKDSTALTHTVCVECGHRDWHVLSIKDDLDFPGEEEYVRQWGATWTLTTLDVVHPPFSLQDWLREHSADLDAGDDMHGRMAGLSREGFYAIIDAYTERIGADGVCLGLRWRESAARKMHRATRGPIYEHSDGRLRCQPLCDWDGIDVFAYLLSRDIDPLPLYRCVGLREDPAGVRKSWWLPGLSCSSGGATWLRTYYPSLYGRLCEMLPSAKRYT